jgi:LCP family protein required for cell wall assembly
MRRATHGVRPRRPRRQRGGCGSLVVGLITILLMASLVLVVVTNLASQRFANMERVDPRQRASQAAGSTSDGSSEGSDSNLPEPSSNLLEQPFNVLLVGVDSRDNPDEIARSDTLIVVHVEPEEQWASMLSIPRDSVTQIPNLGQTKINAAYSFGYNNAEELYGDDTPPDSAGAALAAEAVERFLDIRIDYIAQVDFRGFERVVDTFGGLTIDVPQPLLDAEYPTEDYGYERIYVPAGIQVLDGRMALRYARSRHGGSDFDRSCRQQRVLRAMLREVRTRNLLDQAALIPDLVEDIEQSVSTTLPISDPGVIFGMIELAQSLNRDRIQQYSINPSNVQVIAERSSDIYWNERDIQLLVERMMAGPAAAEQEEVAAIQVQNGAGVRGLATRVTNNLNAQGFRMVEATDSPRPYEHSTIIDYTGHPETRQELAEALGIALDYVHAEPTDNDAPSAPYNTDIVLVLGSDYDEAWATLPETNRGATPPPLPANAAEEPAPNLPPGCSPDY